MQLEGRLPLVNPQIHAAYCYNFETRQPCHLYSLIQQSSWVGRNLQLNESVLWEWLSPGEKFLHKPLPEFQKLEAVESAIKQGRRRGCKCGARWRGQNLLIFPMRPPPGSTSGGNKVKQALLTWAKLALSRAAWVPESYDPQYWWKDYFSGSQIVQK